jgi:hypothetical protein
MWNNLRTTFLMAAMTGLRLVIGELWAGWRRASLLCVPD